MVSPMPPMKPRMSGKAFCCWAGAPYDGGRRGGGGGGGCLVAAGRQRRGRGGVARLRSAVTIFRHAVAIFRHAVAIFRHAVPVPYVVVIPSLGPGPQLGQQVEEEGGGGGQLQTGEGQRYAGEDVDHCETC